MFLYNERAVRGPGVRFIKDHRSVLVFFFAPKGDFLSYVRFNKIP